MEWWYAENGRQIGPVPEEMFHQLVGAGTVKPSTFVWRTGLDQWKPYAEVGGVTAEPRAVAATGPAGRFCSECGRQFASGNLTSFGAASVCADCKPVFTQRLHASGAVPRSSTVYGGFWIRVLARLIDALIMWAFIFALAVPLIGISRGGENVSLLIAMQSVLWIVQIGAALAYEVLLTVHKGGTLGKMALGLRIVTPDGAGLTYGRAVGRYFAQWINAFTLGIGYIVAGFDAEKRALHDYICGTRVVRKRA